MQLWARGATQDVVFSSISVNDALHVDYISFFSTNKNTKSRGPLDNDVKYINNFLEYWFLF